VNRRRPERARRWLAGALLLAGAVTGLAEDRQNPETPMLGQQDYRIPLEDVVVFGQVPYWKKPEPPRWEKEPLQVPAEEPSRLRWAPRYTRDERDDYRGPPDRLNPQPRMKLFELKF